MAKWWKLSGIGLLSPNSLPHGTDGSFKCIHVGCGFAFLLLEQNLDQHIRGLSPTIYGLLLFFPNRKEVAGYWPGWFTNVSTLWMSHMHIVQGLLHRNLPGPPPVVPPSVPEIPSPSATPILSRRDPARRSLAVSTKLIYIH